MVTRQDQVSLRDRFQGLMAGIAVGDALGRPLEGLRAVPDRHIDDLIARSEWLLYSDDTVMSMASTESLLECGEFDGGDMAHRFADAWSQEPERGYGSNVVMVFGQSKEASTGTPPGSISAAGWRPTSRSSPPSTAGADFEDTIRRALSIGGDTDTIPALAGAHWGVLIPASCRVESYGKMVRLADALYARIED